MSQVRYGFGSGRKILFHVGAAAALLLTTTLHAGCSADRTGGVDDGDKPRVWMPGDIPPVPIDPPAPQCKKVDVLFVIDDSGSMADNQKSLIKSFPGFISGLRKRLAGAQDYHIGVVTSDDNYYNVAGCTSIGGLITRTGGPASSNKSCGPFDGGGHYLLNSDAMLEQRFACAAQVGAGGSDDERMARALLEAVSPKNAAKGKCNEGFLRPDSLLVVVMITDEDDVPDGCDGSGTCMTYGSGDDPDKWYDEFLRSRKQPENVVVLSLLGRRAPNPCGAVAASRLMRFTNKFGKNAFLGDICASSYDQFFEDALPVLDRACSVFVPPPA
jgi:hypothetical protein